jgi:hypothetical protein
MFHILVDAVIWFPGPAHAVSCYLYIRVCMLLRRGELHIIISTFVPLLEQAKLGTYIHIRHILFSIIYMTKRKLFILNLFSWFIYLSIYLSISRRTCSRVEKSACFRTSVLTPEECPRHVRSALQVGKEGSVGWTL